MTARRPTFDEIYLRMPDWMCEILSPTTARDDRLLKLPLYASADVGWIWLVAPTQRSIEVYETSRVACSTVFST